MIDVEPGDVFVSLKPVEGWNRIRIIEVHPEVVRVEFLEPKSWWAKGVTGVLSCEKLRHFRKEVKAVAVDFAIDRLYLNSVDGILARGQRKG